jgi:hypothetical protein
MGLAKSEDGYFRTTPDLADGDWQKFTFDYFEEL